MKETIDQQNIRRDEPISKSLPSKRLSKICTEWPNVCSFRGCHSEDQILPAITTQSQLRSEYQEIWLKLVLLDIVKSNPPLVCWKFSHHEIYHPMHKLINPIFSKKIKWKHFLKVKFWKWNFTLDAIKFFKLWKNGLNCTLQFI